MDGVLRQIPEPGGFVLRWRGDTFAVELRLAVPRTGRAVFRSNLGASAVWTDYPLTETSPGVFRAEIPLDAVGVFAGKACFFPVGSDEPEWPAGEDLRIKVVSAETRANNAIYTVFPRQFGSFREVVRRLDTIMDRMGFRIVQTLPPFPVPVTYAVMGKLGCPFAATDFLSVDPAMAEFDPKATPLDQFRELIDAVHARGGSLFIDLPANHTGWGSTLQTHHPEWFRRDGDGRFVSPGAWGVVWEDLVELDYAHEGLRDYMEEVFLFWCRQGVDGFRCDAGYMLPERVWTHLAARVRAEYPDTVFLLEGLGGDLAVTDRLLADAGLDWAYSEIFQTYDRAQFEWYLPAAIRRAERYGALVHFAETHDNDRLAKGGCVYSRLRVQLAALLSWQGAWGIANGVEWYATEKIDVHDGGDLRWGAVENQIDLIGRLNRILATHPSFTGAVHLELVTRGAGNTLAVLRGNDLLVLANLDCAAESAIDFDRGRVVVRTGFDLLTERKVDLTGSVRLAPGEVKCLQLKAPPRAATARDDATVTKETTVRWCYPSDCRREVVCPAGSRLGIAGAVRFRARLVDPADGRTCAVARSAAGACTLVMPAYAGDGTRARRLALELIVYEDGRTVRTHGTICVPPPAETARMKLSLSGEEVRRNPLARGILATVAGAAGQVRAGFGRLASQYDAFLAANPNPAVPSDRLVLWTRTRAWLRSQGRVFALNEEFETGFFVDPAGGEIRWEFAVPMAPGERAAVMIRLALAEEGNAARLTLERRATGAGDARRVRIVLRPDLEWRSFHATTKAQAQNLEARFERAVKPLKSGFVFAPFGGTFRLTVAGGAYHHEPEWSYNLPHDEEAARGQEGAGDVFSPGWIAVDLGVDGSATVTGESGADAPGAFRTAEPTPDDFAGALERAMRLFIVRRDGLKTVIAGYPWFLDWGRDTFIFMRGMIAAGLFDDSLEILRAFAAFEERGTLPNIICGKTAGNRDTTDAPLWFVRCVAELTAAVGRRRKLADACRKLVPTCVRIIDNYLAGTPNGIRVDAVSGLVWSPAHFTWMDTNYPACTPREGYPVEIQALWIAALRFLGRDELAARAEASVRRLFRTTDDVGYCDCLDAPAGTPAAEAKPDAALRPNQLFLVTLGVVEDPVIVRACEPLLVPGGIRSLGVTDARYRGVYSGDEDTSRKPAYHNGTVWTWVMPSYAEALAKVDPASTAFARQLLAAAVENVNTGCLCQLSEIADGDAPHAQKGCAAQAWSVSELLRVWKLLKDLGEAVS